MIAAGPLGFTAPWLLTGSFCPAPSLLAHTSETSTTEDAGLSSLFPVTSDYNTGGNPGTDTPSASSFKTSHCHTFLSLVLPNLSCSQHQTAERVHVF